MSPAAVFSNFLIYFFLLNQRFMTYMSRLLKYNYHNHVVLLFIFSSEEKTFFFNFLGISWFKSLCIMSYCHDINLNSSEINITIFLFGFMLYNIHIDACCRVLECHALLSCQFFYRYFFDKKK